MTNILKLFLERGANLDAADPSGTTVRKLIENSLEDMNDQERDEVRRILEQYPVGHFKKSFQKVESWLSKSIDEFEDQESSVSSIQSVNEDMRILRDENIKVMFFATEISDELYQFSSSDHILKKNFSYETN